MRIADLCNDSEQYHRYREVLFQELHVIGIIRVWKFDIIYTGSNTQWLQFFVIVATVVAVYIIRK